MPAVPNDALDRTFAALSDPTRRALLARLRDGSATVTELARRSKERVDQSEEFAEVREDIREAIANDGLVRLADILKEREEAKLVDATDASATTGVADGESASVHTEAVAPEDDQKLTPQVEEALNVLGDLVSLARRGV